jgi:hypothetical protein
MCLGTPQHLKAKFGRGYTIELKSTDHTNEDALKGFVEHLVPEAVLESCFWGFVKYTLPQVHGVRVCGGG